MKLMAKKKQKPTAKSESKKKEFLEYNLAGMAFFVTSYVTLVGLDYLGLPLWISSTVSYLLGLSVNFVLERYWVFDSSKDNSAFAVATERYIALSAVNLILNYVVLKVLETLGVPIAIAPFLAAGIFTPWNWFWYKYYVFAKTKKKR